MTRDEYKLLSNETAHRADRVAILTTGVLFCLLCCLLGAWYCMTYEYYGALLWFLSPAIVLALCAMWCVKRYAELRHLTRFYYYESRPDLARKLG